MAITSVGNANGTQTSQVPNGTGLFPNGVPAGGVNQTNEYGLGGPGVSAPGYTFVGTPSGGGNDSPVTNTYDAQAAAARQAAIQRQQNIDFVNQSFDTKLAGLQSQFDTLGAQEGAGTRQINNQFNTRNTRLNQDVQTGRGNLDTSANKIVDSRLRGLKSISDQLRQQGMSYNNQLGTFGAGDSSAQQLINYAIGGQASKNRGELVRNASDQTTAVESQRKELETNYQRNVQDLETWKGSALQDLSLKYAEIKNQIQNEMVNANIQRQQQLAQYDASVTQAAISQLQNIQANYQRQAQDLNARFNAMAPDNAVNINQGLLNYDVKPIDPGVVASVDLPASVNPEAARAAILRKRQEDQPVA